MSIRKLNFPGDLENLQELIVDSFQYPEHPEWSIDEEELEGVKDTVSSIRRVWPLYRMIRWMSPSLRDALLGYLWVEEEKPVGLVTYSRRGNTDSWMIGNVAVLPAYRRRGIARELVRAALKAIRQQGGTLTVLDVIDGNLPAYHLYESLGFERYTSAMELILRELAAGEAPGFPDGYQLEEFGEKEWRIRFEIARATMPETVQAYDPVTEERYRRPLVTRLFMTVLQRLQGMKRRSFALRKAPGTEPLAVGVIDAVTKSGGRHYLTFYVREEHPGLVGPLLDFLLGRLREISPDHSAGTMIWEWEYFTLGELEKRGFEIRKKGHRMGLRM